MKFTSGRHQIGSSRNNDVKLIQEKRQLTEDEMDRLKNQERKECIMVERQVGFSGFREVTKN